MTGWSMRYLDRARMLPERPVGERLRDHREIHPPFDAATASAQAARCEQCGTPYCQVYCPLHDNIPDWLALTAQGRFREAFELARATNNMPGICGRICPQDRLCEAKGACTLEQSGHGAVTIGHVERWLGIAGEDLPGVLPALDWLVDACRPLWGEPSRAEWSAAGRRVVVVGGGDTAMDCIRTALRQGAREVLCLYRRDEAQRPGSPREFRHAEREGGRFFWRVAPGAIEPADAGGDGPSVPVGLLAAEPLAIGQRRQLCVRALATRPIRASDGSLRYEPELASPTVITADLVIVAAGLAVEPPERWTSGLLGADARGRLPVDPRTHATPLPGVFAAGDVARGPSLAVRAIREGRGTAAAVAAWLDSESRPSAESLPERSETPWTGS